MSPHRDHQPGQVRLHGQHGEGRRTVRHDDGRGDQAEDAGGCDGLPGKAQCLTPPQAFAGLEQTGEVDRETKVMMQTPRCGMKDVVGQGSYAKRKKR